MGKVNIFLIKFKDKNMELINIADIINPETGKSYRHENNEKKHNIELGRLVEINFDDSYSVDKKKGLRLFVVSHHRDCDGTPLYGLSFDRNWHELMFGEDFKVFARWAVDWGYSEGSLKIIE